MVLVYALPTKLVLNIPLINSEIVDAATNKFLLGKRLVFRYSDRLLSNSYAGLKAYEAPQSKSRVIYNGFDTNRLSNLQEQLGIREKFSIKTPFVVGMIASFLPGKDYPTFIESAIKILKQGKEVTFLCIGDGNYQELQNSIPSDVVGQIKFLGKLQHVEQVMNICTVGVLMTDTRYHGEGISNALLEFMALGKPVIATDHGGTKELIEPEQSGYLIPPFSVELLTEKLNFLLENESIRYKFGNRGKEISMDKFSISKMIHSFEEEYSRYAPENLK